MECAICFMEFVREVVPRVLDCGHTLCEVCLEAVARDGRIECVYCRAVHVLPRGGSAAGLRRNYALEEALRARDTLAPPPVPALLRLASDPEAHRPEPLRQVPPPPCVSCGAAEAVLRCAGCRPGGQLYCAPCLARAHGHPECGAHAPHRARLWCGECAQLVCSECVRVGGHARHERASVPGAANRARLALERRVAAARDAVSRASARAERDALDAQGAGEAAAGAAAAVGEAMAAVAAAAERRRAELADELARASAVRAELLRAAVVRRREAVRVAEKALDSVSRTLAADDVALLRGRAAAEARLVEAALADALAAGADDSSAGAAPRVAGLDEAVKACVEALARAGVQLAGDESKASEEDGDESEDEPFLFPLFD